MALIDHDKSSQKFLAEENEALKQGIISLVKTDLITSQGQDPRFTLEMGKLLEELESRRDMSAPREN